jgi:hypothetical protein
MESIFDALPGLETPVGTISGALAAMWESTAAKGGPAPSSDDTKATQVNFILHLGAATTAADAAVQFQTAVMFSRRYPSRVVVLCPVFDESMTQMRAKIYGECTLGKSRDDTRCCEFVMLSYPMGMRQFLENQVSVCLSTDLPLYYWAHRFTDNALLSGYTYFLTTAKRVLFDSSVALPGTLSFPWPRPENVRDLVYARLLPVRQSVGQFLSRYARSVLAEGLISVTVGHDPAMAAEGQVLLDWCMKRIEACGATDVQSQAAASDLPGALSVMFRYNQGKSFRWTGDLDKKHALFEADFGTGRTVLPAAVSLLSPESALSEAVFF